MTVFCRSRMSEMGQQRAWLANASRLVVRQFMGSIADSREQPKTGKAAPAAVVMAPPTDFVLILGFAK